jgi:hypothetical protein
MDTYQILVMFGIGSFVFWVGLFIWLLIEYLKDKEGNDGVGSD